MKEFVNIENFYFVGIGGIGMSALARYVILGGYSVAGYDRTESDITKDLVSEGCDISYTDDTDTIPETLTADSTATVVIYTPAIPAENNILSFFRNNGYRLIKRAELLGKISVESNNIAIAGTHGKTTITSLTAHLLKQSSLDCTAFLGGISRNYMTNMITGAGDITVMEADEFDRSFHNLAPRLALITSIDADHLDIYENYGEIVDSYNKFAKKILKGGSLVINDKIRDKIKNTEGVTFYTYGFEKSSDFRINNLKKEKGAYVFDLVTPEGIIKEVVSLSTGRASLENIIAGMALALLSGVTEHELKRALIHFKGVVRRLDIRINTPEIVYIDDYAHHPRELNFVTESVRDHYGDRKITAVFQPHLYTRTRDHAAGFAESLDGFDRVILLPVYPAREEPIEGVNSGMILSKMKLDDKVVVEKEKLLEYLENLNIEILLTIGAGDIDRVVKPIEIMLKRRSG
ncbi:MAG: UDP-N-acetylmuramate--L-alanine ligase [Bacteroidales bacterium]|nr:UDP-N-acetylmuramate--L-alanine ligase [Bacteroidales bacterium]